MFKSKSHGDIKKSSQKVLDHKKDILARLKHLKIVIDAVEAPDLKVFFEANFSHIYYIFYEVFFQIEQERRQKGFRLHKDEFDILLLLFEKILVLLPSLVHRRWQFHSIGRLLKKLLHSGNALKVRREGVRLFVIWYQIMQENNSDENHFIFARLAHLTPADAAYFSFSDRALASTDNPVCASEIHAVQPPSSAEKGPDKACVFFLELLLTFVVSEVSKVEWSNPAQKQVCFVFLFENFKQHYLFSIFPAFESKTTIYTGIGGGATEDSLPSARPGVGNCESDDCASMQTSPQMFDCRDVIVRWFTTFVQLSRQQHSDETAIEKAPAGDEEKEVGSADVTVSSTPGSPPDGAGGGGQVVSPEDTGTVLATAADDGGAVRTSVVTSAVAGLAAMSQPVMAVTLGSKASSLSNGSVNNISSSTASDDGEESLHDGEPRDFSQYEIVRSVLFGSRENVDLIHEVFRQAFLLPLRLSGGIRRVVAVYKEWLQIPAHRPIFLQDPLLLTLPGGKLNSGGDLCHSAAAVCDLADSGTLRRRPHSYIAAVKWEGGASRDGVAVKAGLRNSMLLFIRHSAHVFEKETCDDEPVATQVRLCMQVVNLYRYIVMKLTLDQPTWEQLLCVLLKIATALLGRDMHNAELAKELAAPVLQTLIVTWIKANLYVHIGAELWDSLLDTLSSLTHWQELINEWAKTMDTLTRILARQVYNLDLNDLPLDRLSDMKSRRLRGTSIVPPPKEKKAATFSRAYSGLDSTGTGVAVVARRPPLTTSSVKHLSSPPMRDDGAANGEEDGFATLASRRHRSATEARVLPSDEAQQPSSGKPGIAGLPSRLPRSNSDSNIPESLDWPRGSTSLGIPSPDLSRDAVVPWDTPPLPPRGVPSTAESTRAESGWAPGVEQQHVPPPLPARPKTGIPGKSADRGPPPPLPPPQRLEKRHVPELGPDPSPAIDQSRVKRLKDSTGMRSQHSPVNARGSEVTKSANVDSGVVIEVSAPRVPSAGHVGGTSTLSLADSASSLWTPHSSGAEDSSGSGLSGISLFGHAQSAVASDMEESLVHMDFFASSSLTVGQEGPSDVQSGSSTYDSWSAIVAAAAAVPDETVSVASTDEYKMPYYDLMPDGEAASGGSVVAGGETGSSTNTFERSELQALLSAESRSSGSPPPSSPASSNHLFNYLHGEEDAAALREVDDSPADDSPPPSPTGFPPRPLATAARGGADGSIAAKQETPDRESLHIDEASHEFTGVTGAEIDFGDRRSVIFGGQLSGWTPATSVVLWRRMLGILGNPNLLPSPRSHAAVFDYLLELLTVLLKIADNQGVVTGSQQGTPPPPEVAAPILFLAPLCIKAQELSGEYRRGKLTALRMLCMMTLRRAYTPPSEGHLAQFYMAVHRGLIGNDQDTINVLVKHLSPNLFALNLSGATILIMDVINATGSVISLGAVKEVPHKEGLVLLGSLVCFPNHFGEMPVLYEGRSDTCSLASKHMKDCVIKLLVMAGKKEPTSAARCIALSGLGIYLVEELSASTCHDMVKDAINVLLLSLKFSTPAVAWVACDMLALLSEHVDAVRKLRPELPARIVSSIATQLSENMAAPVPVLDENLIVSVLFCLLSWCMRLDLAELMSPATAGSGGGGAGQGSGETLLRKVFTVLYQAATNSEQLSHGHACGGGSNGGPVEHGLDALPTMLAAAVTGSEAAPPPVAVSSTGGASRQLNSQHAILLEEPERVQAAAKYIVNHMVNHLCNYPVESEMMPVLSAVQEQHDLTVTNLGGKSSIDDLTDAVFCSPNLQVFVYNNSTLISCMEIEKRDIDLGTQFVSNSTTARFLVRDVTGKYCWNATLLYGQPKKMSTPDHQQPQPATPQPSVSRPMDENFDEEPFSEKALGRKCSTSSSTRPQSPSSPISLHDVPSSVSTETNHADGAEADVSGLALPSYDAFIDDELAEVLQHIAEVTPECQLIPGRRLDVPYPPTDEVVGQLEDEVVERLLRQQSDDNQCYAEHQKDYKMAAISEEAPTYQEPISAFLQCRQFLHQFGFLSWESRQKIDLLEKNDRLLRELKNLDNQLRCRETHKVAVVYVAEGQEDKRAVLSNCAGSEAFESFVAGLGWEVELATHTGFMGGLQRDGKTGDTAPYYATSLVEVLFHVSTRMPALTEDDLHRKLKHLGNDEVHIIWSEHYREYRRGIISTEFGDVLIIIYPLQNSLYRIRVDKKPEVPYFGPLFDGAIVDRKVLPLLVRATAINASRQQRLTLPLFHPFFVQRMRSIEKIVQDCRKPSTFEAFVASVFSPMHAIHGIAPGSSGAAEYYTNIDNEMSAGTMEAASTSTSKKDDSPEISVAVKPMRRLSMKRGRSLLQRRHTDARSPTPPPSSPSPTSTRKK